MEAKCAEERLIVMGKCQKDSVLLQILYEPASHLATCFFLGKVLVAEAASSCFLDLTGCACNKNWNPQSGSS